MQLSQQTWYVTAVTAVDAATDRLMISPQMPGQNNVPAAYSALSAEVAKPHSHTTGEALIVTIATPA